MNVERIKAIYIKDGYASKRRSNLDGWYRDMTVYEAKKFYGTAYAVDKNGNVRECRSNGAPKTWKTRPGCELPLKYGLKECFRVGGDERRPEEPLSASWQVRIVVPVKAKFEPNCPADIVADYVMEHECNK